MRSECVCVLPMKTMECVCVCVRQAQRLSGTKKNTNEIELNKATRTLDSRMQSTGLKRERPSTAEITCNYIFGVSKIRFNFSIFFWCFSFRRAFVYLHFFCRPVTKLKIVRIRSEYIVALLLLLLRRVVCVKRSNGNCINIV